MNLAIKPVVALDRDWFTWVWRLHGPGNVQVLESLSPWGLMTAPTGLQHKTSKLASVVAQAQPQHSNALMVWEVVKQRRKNDSTSWHFLLLNCPKSSDTELWDRNTIRKHFSVSQLFFLKTMGFHKIVHEVVTTYISIKTAFAFIMQWARNYRDHYQLPHVCFSLHPPSTFPPVYSPLEGSNSCNTTQEMFTLRKCEAGKLKYSKTTPIYSVICIIASNTHILMLLLWLLTIWLSLPFTYQIFRGAGLIATLEILFLFANANWLNW